jgi:hypothetical protein
VVKGKAKGTRIRVIAAAYLRHLLLVVPLDPPRSPPDKQTGRVVRWDED